VSPTVPTAAADPHVAPAGATSDLARLARYRELLFMLAWRDIRVRYKQSAMGLLWAVLMPAIIVGAGALVRVAAAELSGTEVTASDISSVMIRAVLWSFVVSVVRFGTASLVANPSLVTKIAFPKEVFPLAAVLSSAFDFGIALIAVLLALPWLGWTPSLQALWAIPLLGLLVAMVAGATLVLAALNLYFRDVKYIVEVLLTYAIFVTPVLYPASFAGRWEHLVLLNPVAPLLEGISDAIVLAQPPDLSWTAYSAAVAALALGLGYRLFKRLEAEFAERI
jgi:ABC-type polysaccharide/polyol phosphate export permease